jgi:hypothetical protein
MRNRVFVVSTITVLASTLTSYSTSFAGWGCGVSASAGEHGFDWNKSTKESATQFAIADCQTAGAKNCHIIDCRENVDSREQAEAIWGRISNIQSCTGNGCR